MTKLVTTKYKNHIVDQLVESITETSNTEYYIFTSDHVDRTSATIPTPIDKNREVEWGVYHNMLFGKRLTSSDIKPMVKKNAWTSGTRYTMYDDNDDDLYDQEFFVVVDETSWLHVYKCLDNNGNTPSTSQPTFSHITGSNTSLYETSDGYRWKYMYSFSASDDDQFSTAEYIPVVANSTVISQADSGAIDIIKVDDGGKNYGNYTSGTFVSGDIRVSGNDVLYAISNNTLNTTNGYYTGCIMYIATGAGAGQYKRVNTHFSNSSGSYVGVNSAFSTTPSNGDDYQIHPEVVITGDGQQTTNAVARALINSTSTNSVYRVEMLNRGANYKYHIANVTANAVVGVTSTASVRPIYSPHLGHGHDVDAELGAKHFCIGAKFSNSESNTIPTLNDFEKVGLMINPMFTNVYVTYTTSNGTFQNGETARKITPIQVDTAATINTSSGVVSSNTGQFLTQFANGDWVYLKAGNNSAHMISQVDNITNATYMTISANGTFACTNTVVYIANVTASAVVNATVNSTVMVFNNVAGIFQTDDEYIGVTTGSRAVVNSIARNGVTKDFDTFINMFKYTATVTSGTYTDDEVVFEGVDLATSTANARLHSSNVDGGTATIYTTNNVGVFSNSGTIEGNTSGATATITTKYNPELVYGSGDVIFLENIQAVARANNQTETLKLIFAL
jgi:hypothetical protein